MGSRLFCSHGYLLLPLLSRLYFFQDILEHFKTRCRWMTHDMVLGPVMEMMRKSLDGTVMRSVIPSLDQQAITILPGMTILADFEVPLDFDGPFGALSQTTKNRKVEVRKLLIFQSQIFGFSR